MNERPEDQGGEASSEVGKGQREAAPERRPISKEELRRVLEEHRRWLETDGREGERANLLGADLQSANLQGADLRRAFLGKVNLQGANLQGADLRRAVLGKVNLQGANLQGADLSNVDLQEVNLKSADLLEVKLDSAYLVSAELQGASLVNARLSQADLRDVNLQGADLQWAALQMTHLASVNFGKTDLTETTFEPDELVEPNFQDAILSDMDLTNAKSFLAYNLRGAVLTNAKLPEGIDLNEGLKHVEETSQNARKIFFGLLLGCFYAWLTIATTDDARLLTNSASSPLPIIGTEIPIAWFYGAASLILLGVYFYLHLYLLRLWQGLGSLPAVFPDGKALDERAYPWLLNGLVRGHVPRLRTERPPLSRLQNLVSVLLAWWVVPLTLLALWLRYLPRQDWWSWHGTVLQISCVVMAAAFGLLSYLFARRLLRGEHHAFLWKTFWRDGRTYISGASIFFGALLWVLSLGVIEGDRLLVQTEQTRDGGRELTYQSFPRGRKLDPDFTDPRVWVPRVFERLGYIPFADLTESAVSVRPDNYWEIIPEDRDKSVAGADLRYASLRHAKAHSAFMTKADLRRANLQEAYLSGANLQEADLQSANLQEADLRRANLQEADLWGANLQVADLWSANLQEADLRRANLQGANLRDTRLLAADLKDADLRGADLREADLRYANLRGANLRGADLQEADLRSAKFWDDDLNEEKLPAAQSRACDQLRAARNWKKAYLDEALACGASIPQLPNPPTRPIAPE